MRKFIIIYVCFLMLVSQNAEALHQGGNDLPYSQGMSHPLDKPMNDQYKGKCFFFNLGPTGIRARIDTHSPKFFKVMYVFQDSKSPAKGLIEIGDLIVGANGKLFENPMGFHRKQGGRGWPGPPFELAKALEDSQGKDGKLTLIVWPKGRDNQKKTVELQLKPVGRFSKTFPWDCPRSDQLSKDLCDFLLETGVKAKTDYRSVQHILALMAAGDKRALPLLTQAANGLKGHKSNTNSSGFASWRWGFNGLILGEYYNITKDKGVLAAVKELNYGFEAGQDWRSGGFSHKPWPHIQQRIANNGPKGYGSMACPGGLSMLSQSLFQANGLPISEMSYDRTHQAYLQTAGGNRDASFAYGFKGYESIYVYLKDGEKSPCKSEKGIGYICPTGMTDIGEFEVEKWTSIGSGKWKMDVISDWKDVKKQWPWVVSEADKLQVYDMGHKVGNYNKNGKHRRQIMRPKVLTEPKTAYQTGAGGCGHPSAVGMGAVAHYVGNKGNKAWNFLGRHMATCCAKSYKFVWDNHASAELGAFFCVLGASWADKKDRREFLDYSKTWIILSETHDGGLVEQPFGCQRNATGSVARDRKSFTSVAILLLSLHKKKLLITGKGSDGGGPTKKKYQIVLKPAEDIKKKGYEIEYLKEEMGALKKGKSYVSVLRTLDRIAKGFDDKGDEAIEMGRMLRMWITGKSKELLRISRTKPMTSLSEIERFLKLATGLEIRGLNTLRARVKQVKKMNYFSELYSVSKKKTSLLAKIRDKGRSVSTDKSKITLLKRVENTLTKKGMDKFLLAEAVVLLKELGGNPAKVANMAYEIKTTEE